VSGKMIRSFARRSALFALSGISCLLTSCSSDNEGQKIAILLNENATQLLQEHSSERIVLFHPDSGLGNYTVKLEKHFPCPSAPCEAPVGQTQGMVRFTKDAKEGEGGVLERWVSVPQPYSLTRKDQDTAFILQNKGWYAEVRAVY
jgi:hypothetical protein